VADRAVRRAFWGASAFGAVTTVQSLQSLGHEDVLGFHRAWYRPGSATLVLAGDLMPEEGLALARRHFGDWRAGDPPARVQVAPAQAIEASLVVVDMPGSGQSGVVVAVPYVELGAPDRRAAQLAASVLGGGNSARLNEEVRIKRGLSYGASAHAESHEVGGMLVAAAQTRPSAAREVLVLVRAEIERLSREAPRLDELRARQAALVGSYARRLETSGGLAAQIAALIAQRRPLEELARYPEEILAVRPEQVRDVAAHLWGAGSMRAAVAGDAQALGEALKQPGVLVVPIADLDRARLRSGPAPGR
jgi:zinc protease